MYAHCSAIGILRQGSPRETRKASTINKSLTESLLVHHFCAYSKSVAPEKLAPKTGIYPFHPDVPPSPFLQPHPQATACCDRRMGTERLWNEVVVGKKTTIVLRISGKVECVDVLIINGRFQHIIVIVSPGIICMRRRSHRPVKGASCCHMSCGHLAGPVSNGPRSCSPPSERRPSCPGPQRASPPRRTCLRATSPYLPCDCPCHLPRA